VSSVSSQQLCHAFIFATVVEEY